MRSSDQIANVELGYFDGSNSNAGEEFCSDSGSEFGVAIARVLAVAPEKIVRL